MNLYWNKFTLTCILIVSLLSFNASDKEAQLITKAKKHIALSFDQNELLYNKIDLSEIALPLHKDFTSGYLFQLKHGETKLGYAFVGEANSMKDVFDYLIIFDNELKIKKSKVLIYREQHGQQIGSLRWLKQFVGLGIEDSPQLGRDIQGISGATISATSMTEATNMVLQSFKQLIENGFFAD